MTGITSTRPASQADKSLFEAEVASRFGLVPNFFQTAPDAPGLIQELWAFAKSGYLDNPLPSVFKERLFVHVSRFCEVRYCIVRHLGFLIGHGNPSGDPEAMPNTVEQALTLLRQPAMLTDAELDAVYARLAALEVQNIPAMETQAERDVFAAAGVLFAQPVKASLAAEALRNALGNTQFEILTAFLAFIRTAHYWTLTHPNLAFENDMVTLLKSHEQLAEILLSTSDADRSSMGIRLYDELMALRQEHDDRAALRQALADRETAHRHQQLLINELNHRVKNTLAIVQSLAYQTLRGADVPSEVREAFTGRLVALAEAHDLLNTEKWEGASLQDVLHQAIRAQFPDTNDRVRLHGSPLKLDPKQAFAIAMATHELTTNAIKYGALSVADGYLDIAWQVYPAANEPWMELTWKEVGGPPVTPPERMGFGSRLIQRGLAAELDGEASLRFEKTGLECTVRAPLRLE